MRLKQRCLARSVGFSRFVVIAGLILRSLCWVDVAELARFGLAITRTTPAHWVAVTDKALELLYRLVHDDLIAGMSRKLPQNSWSPVHSSRSAIRQ